MKKSNFANGNNKLINRLKREKPILKVGRTFLHPLDSFVPKSKVINSSKIMGKQSMNNKIQISEKWDKFDVFARKKRESSKRYGTQDKIKTVVWHL